MLTKVSTVRGTGDHGMLGFALADDYASSGHDYISYDKGDPATSGHGMVEEWTASPPDSPSRWLYAAKRGGRPRIRAATSTRSRHA